MGLLSGYIDRSGKRHDWLSASLAQGPFGIGSKRLKRSINLDERDAAKEAMRQEQAATQKAEQAEANKPFEAPTSGPFRHAYDKEGRSVGGPFGMALRAKYAKEDEEKSKRKKRLEQYGINI